MVSDVRVTAHTREGELELHPYLTQLSVADGLDAPPVGTLSTPLYLTRGRRRVRFRDLITPGDLVTVEMLAWDGRHGDWTTVLHGPVMSSGDHERLARGYENGSTFQIGSMSDILAQDAVAWWMFYGTLDGYARVRSALSIDRMSNSPYRVMFEYLQQVAFDRSVYANPTGLAELMHLDFDGFESLSPIALSLTAAEGSHLEIISRYLDGPLHELYTTTAPARAARGALTHAVAAPHTHDGGLTMLVWRKAPYPYLDGHHIRADEWQRLPLHRAESGVKLINSRQAQKSKEAVRNFFIAYPAVQFLNERFAYAFGACYVNMASVRRFGYRPLKLRTHLIADKEAKQGPLEEFMHRLTARIAGQWNHMERYEGGQLELPPMPHLRPGERLQAPSPWTENRLFEYHVRGRKLDWHPERGATMQVAVERGLPVEHYQDPAHLAAGLQRVRVGAESYAAASRLQDTPGQ